MNNGQLLEHHYQGKIPLRMLWLLFESDRLRFLIASMVFIIKHSSVWLLPLLTANIINVIVEHRPIAKLWWNTLLLALLLFKTFHSMFYTCVNSALPCAAWKHACVRRSRVNCNADRIIVLDHGHIVEMGTHTELLEHNGVFSRMQKEKK